MRRASTVWRLRRRHQDRNSEPARYHAVGEEISAHTELAVWFYPKGQEPKHREVLALFNTFSGQTTGARALDIARPFRAADIQVAMGGFHVSGCLSMLDGSAIDLDLARDLGISMFAGEAEDRFDAFLRDAAAGRLQPLYNYMSDLPGLGGTPIPFLPRDFVKRTAGTNASFDAGRGCPFQCSFCTIINVQGRKSRYRSPDDIEKIVRDLRVHQILEGTNEIMRLIVSRKLIEGAR